MTGFINEARLLARFDHPALVKVHHFLEQHKTGDMAMRYYEGQTFKSIIANDPTRVNQEWLQSILNPILEVLGFRSTESGVEMRGNGVKGGLRFSSSAKWTIDAEQRRVNSEMAVGAAFGHIEAQLNQATIPLPVALTRRLKELQRRGKAGEVLSDFPIGT